MSANNIVFIKNNKRKKVFEVYYQGCADNEGLGKKEKEFKKLINAVRFAYKLCDKYSVEYGVRFIGF